MPQSVLFWRHCGPPHLGRRNLRRPGRGAEQVPAAPRVPCSLGRARRRAPGVEMPRQIEAERATVPSTSGAGALASVACMALVAGLLGAVRTR